MLSHGAISFLNGSSILVTGGTGSFGRAFTRHILSACEPRRLIIFSRDELKQHEMREELQYDDRLRWFLGDVRDSQRLERAFQGVDFVVHAAALKQVDTAEYNPFEFVKTNVLGSQNVIEAAINADVHRVIALSTDKASSPINLYGATKLTADKLFISANNYSRVTGSKFAVVRYGNVMGSRGSVIPLFRKCIRQERPLPITHPEMTRFWISLQEAVSFVIRSLNDMKGGELFVPKIPSMRLLDLAEAMAPGYPQTLIGTRPGEKIHEEMISADESYRTLRQEGRFVLQPTIADWGPEEIHGQPVDRGFSYRSDTNDQWLNVNDLMKELDKEG